MREVKTSRAAAARPLWLFASLRSLRQYPAKAREWSWAKKFAAIHAAPAYGLSCFGDTWRDVQTLAGDLHRQWRTTP